MPITTKHIKTDAITNAKIADEAVATRHLDDTEIASVFKATGSHTTAGGDAAETITATGATATDIAIVTVKTAGATPRSIVAAAAGTDSIAVTMSGDPSTDHVLSWAIVRAS